MRGLEYARTVAVLGAWVVVCVAGASTIVRVFTASEPDLWGAVVFVAVCGYVAGRVRPKRAASAAVSRRLHAFRKGDRLWRVAVPFIAVHPVVFARHYTREVWRSRRRRRVDA
jgi:hypothetical protein